MLSTKAFSTLLTEEWFQIFTEWITYPVLAVSMSLTNFQHRSQLWPGPARDRYWTDQILEQSSHAF